jgi:LmbE family N-acetylglucosaminyl deacetylase
MAWRIRFFYAGGCGMSSLKLLAVFPHPDDETLGLGGTLAKYAAEGVQTHLVCATRGQRGWFDSFGPNPGPEQVGRIREAELRCAAENLGLNEVVLLDYMDGDVDRADPAEIVGVLAGHIRRIRPQVVVTFGPDGAYGHPDHIALSQFTHAAIVCAADASWTVPDGGAPFRVSKFYYMVDPPDLVQAADRLFGGIHMQVDGVTRSHLAWPDWEITTRFDTRPHLETVHKAMHCHASQLDGYGPLAGLPARDLAWFFGQGTFYRAFSLVNGGRQVEEDLFAGLRG